jgi:oxygen-dependent protoporphyrinogen oxidase
MSGYLVPKPMQRLVTAARSVRRSGRTGKRSGAVVLRISLGRDGLPVLHLSDEQLLAAAIDEVGHHLGLTLQPAHARVSRWAGAFPQYRPHHAQRRGRGRSRPARRAGARRCQLPRHRRAGLHPLGATSGSHAAHALQPVAE